MNRRKSFLAGLFTVLALAALSYVVYRYRDRIAAKLDRLVKSVRRFCRGQNDEYDDFADV